MEDLRANPVLGGLDAGELLRAAPEALVLVRSGSVTWANDRAIALAGADPSGSAIRDLVGGWRDAPEDAVPFEATLVRPDGELTVQVRVAPVPAEDVPALARRPGGLVPHGLSSSGRPRAASMPASVDDLDIRASGQLPGGGLDPARLLAALPEAVLVLRAGHVDYANAAALALLEGDPTGAPVGAVVDGWDDETSEPPELAFARLPDDRRLPVEIKIADVGEGRTVAILRDAGALLSAQEAEAARALAEERYRGLVEQIPAVVYADEGGEHTTYVNPQIEGILGVTPEQYIADPDLWIRMVHPDDRARVQAESDAFLRGEGGDLADYRMVRPDGRIVWIRDRAYAHRDADGRVIWEHGILFDVTELKEAEERIAYMAFHDALTGLANRALFEESLGLAIGRAQRSDLGVAVLFLDLDNFKEVNDSYGHHAGDELLADLAGRLKTCVRESDMVARQGGDEFLMLLGDLEEGAAVPTATHVAERVEDVLRTPFVLQETPVEAHGSIGISLYPTDANDAATLMKQADAAMYRAKRAARGSHTFWSFA